MTTRIRALIVDDEPLGRERIRTQLETAADVEVVAECGDGEAAVRAILEDRPDLVFLDVQMPELDGFGVIREVGADNMPPVIFVTAYDQFAVRAFETSALDYLLKPFDEERFDRALQRARDTLARSGGQGLDERLVALLRQIAPEREYPERWMVRVGSQFQFVRTDEVDWIDTADNYLRLHVGKRVFMIREAIGVMEGKLDPRRFMRIHRSIIVAQDRIHAIEVWNQTEFLVILKDGTKLTSSRSYRDRVRAFLGRE